MAKIYLDLFSGRVTIHFYNINKLISLLKQNLALDISDWQARWIHHHKGNYQKANNCLLLHNVQ